MLINQLVLIVNAGLPDLVQDNGEKKGTGERKLPKEGPKQLTTLFMTALVFATEEFPGAVFVIGALVTVLVCTTDKLPRTVFIIDALVAVHVWATDEFSRAAFFFGAGLFADTLSAVRTGYLAVGCCVEVEPSIFI